MTNYLRTFVLSLALLWLSTPLLSQNNGASTVIGLTAGTSCQTSDVRTDQGGFGLSLTAGKEFPVSPASPLAFELRGRLLFARQYGLDPFPSTGIENNSALNGKEGPDYLQYPAAYQVNKGFAYLNHRTTVGELALEGVLTFEQLRQRGLLLSLYGGIGADWHLTKVNQLDAFGEPYYDLYTSIDADAPTRSRIKELQAGLDDTYETTADGYSPGGSINFMPSLGIELGWQATPNFALIAGHRTTFTLNNIIDGQQWKDDRNDLYHYTYAGLKFNLPGRQNNRLKKPLITIVRPATNPATVSYPEYTLEAKIKRIHSAADIRVLLNGRDIPFQFYGERLLAELYLHPGRNEVAITATNAAGSDHKVVVIILEGNIIQTPPPPPPPSPAKPHVNITQPAKKYSETFETQVTIKADILNVPYRQDVRLFVNGYETSQFQYDGRHLSAYVSLRKGSNSLRITATNPAGTDSDKVTIVLKERSPLPPPPPPPSGPKPQVQITKPADGSTTQQPRIRMTANIRHVDNSRNIQLLLNGRKINDFSFNGQLLSADLQLAKGSNTITVKAANAFGESQDKVRITFAPAPPPSGPKPQVQITKPADGSTTQQPRIRMTANIRHVDNSRNIQLLLNGRKINDFSFNGQLLSADLQLAKGSNTITVKAANAFGESQDKVRVTFAPAPPPSGPKPVITFIHPKRKGERTRKASYALQVKVEHVRGKSDISLKVNGKGIQDFTYDSRSMMLQANIALNKGENTIEVKATNRQGSSKAGSSLLYEKGRPVGPKPEVEITNITQPTGNPFNPNVASCSMSATVKNVDGKERISVTLNGEAVPFTFDKARNQVEADLILQQGENELVVKAVMPGGSAEDKEIISY